MKAWEWGWPHFGDAGSGQVSSVAGPALDSVAASVQLPGASLGIHAAPLLQQGLHPLAQRGLSTPLAPPKVTAVAWYPARLQEGMGGSQLYVVPVDLTHWGGTFSGFLPLLQDKPPLLLLRAGSFPSPEAPSSPCSCERSRAPLGFSSSPAPPNLGRPCRPGLDALPGLLLSQSFP